MIFELTETPDWSLWLAAALFMYAEIHFRFPRLPSLYYRKQPEIIADVPHRIGPGKKLPVLLLVKDANQFPITLVRVMADAIVGKERIPLLNEGMNVTIDDTFHEWLWFVQIPPQLSGNEIQVDVTIAYECNGRGYTIHNDNYPQTSHKPFRVMVDDQPLPAGQGWYAGELHCHSYFSNDQVEFGASLPATAEMARSMELDYMAVTDHSYDLDDLADDYLHNDPLLHKWHRMWHTVEQLNNRYNDFTVIPGEELSAGNANNRNVHMLLLNNRIFFEGNSDSFEPGFTLKPHWSIGKAVSLLQPGALALAAHPESAPPLSQRILLNRGAWTDADYRTEGLDGVQMWNGDVEHFIKHGLKQWVKLLLSGQRSTLVAGNDAHGNFNRFRQLRIPFILMSEHHKEVFGVARTLVRIDGERRIDTIIHAIKQGSAIVSDGPFAEFTLQCDGQSAHIGDTYIRERAELDIRAESTPAFGAIASITLYIGNLDMGKETQLPITEYPPNQYSVTIQKQMDALPARGYIRLKVTSKNRGRAARCFTNPVYIINNK